MTKYTFASQKGKAYYYNGIPEFIHDNAQSIIGELVRHSFEVGKEQTNAWENQIVELQNRLDRCGMDGRRGTSGGGIRPHGQRAV